MTFLWNQISLSLTNGSGDYVIITYVLNVFHVGGPGGYTVDPGTMTKVNCRPSKQFICCFQYFSFSSLAVF